jgi:hypothetical protein
MVPRVLLPGSYQSTLHSPSRHTLTSLLWGVGASTGIPPNPIPTVFSPPGSTHWPKRPGNQATGNLVQQPKSDFIEHVENLRKTPERLPARTQQIEKSLSECTQDQHCRREEARFRSLWNRLGVTKSRRNESSGRLQTWPASSLSFASSWVCVRTLMHVLLRRVGTFKGPVLPSGKQQRQESKAEAK